MYFKVSVFLSYSFIPLFVKCGYWVCKFLSKHIPITSRSDLRIATKHNDSRGSEFPPTEEIGRTKPSYKKDDMVNAEIFTYLLWSEFVFEKGNKLRVCATTTLNVAQTLSLQVWNYFECAYGFRVFSVRYLSFTFSSCPIA